MQIQNRLGMNEIIKIDSVQTYNDYFGVETRHPLVSVVDGREAQCFSSLPVR